MGDRTAADRRPAVVAHLYYPDIGLEIIDRLERLAGKFHLVVTTPPPVDPVIARRLAQWGDRVEIIETENRGRDVGPFLAVLPSLLERGFQVCLKLHTKGRRSPFSLVWRHCAYDALIGSEAVFDRALDAFAADPSLALVGPAPLFVSAATHMLGNAEALQRAAAVCLPGKRLPRDWGFFAGTMFWARTEALKPLLQLRRFGITFGPERRSADGELEHALERLFGLLGAVGGQRTGLMDISTNEPELRLVDRSAPIDGESLTRRLISLKQEHLLDAATGPVHRLMESPLVHYIKGGATGELDPNPLFFNSWYAASLETTLDPKTTPLAHFMRGGWREGRNPSPLFDTADHLARHPDSLNPLAAGLAARRRSPADAPPSKRPRPLAAWPRGPGLSRSADPTAQRAFVASLGESSRASAIAGAKQVSVCIPLLDADDDMLELFGSVLAQSHPPAEIVLSVSPVTERAVASLVRERSIAGAKIVRSSGGLPAALNLALAATTGDFIAYLQPGRRWRPDHLRLLTTLMVREELGAAASIAAFKEGGSIYAYQGQCADLADGEPGAPIDLSALCHARGFSPARSGFDETVAAPVVEFVRRCAASGSFVLAPFVGCESSAIGYTIKSAAEPGDTGGHALATLALAQAMEKAGARVRVDARGAWYDAPPSPATVVVALRSGLRYEPRRGEINVLVHPADEALEHDEAEDFDLVLVASETEADFLRLLTSRPVAALPPPAGEDGGQSRGLSLFPPSPAIDVDGVARGLTGGNLASSLAVFSPATRELLPLFRSGHLGRAQAGRRRIRIIHRPVARGFHSSTYIRVLAPLLNPAMPRAEISATGVNDILGADESDVCIVVRSGIDDAEVADTLIERLRRSGTELIVDLDDAFRLVAETDPWFAKLSARSAVIDRLLSAADQCWFSTERLAEAYGDIARRAEVAPNNLDPRLWRGAGPLPPIAPPSTGALKFLCMGSRRHAEDFDLLLPALDRLSQTAPGAFHVTVIGMAPRIPERPWLEHRFPPSDATPYVPFVAWLRRQGPFHVGLAPLRDTALNACKSDIKFLDYSALGLLSVLSDVPAYHGDAKTKGLALFSSNIIESWHDALHSLIHDRPNRALAEAATNYAWRERSLAGGSVQRNLLLGLNGGRYSAAVRQPAEVQCAP